MGIFSRNKKKGAFPQTPGKVARGGRPPKTPGTASTVASANSSQDHLAPVQRDLIQDLNVVTDGNSSDMLEVVIGDVPKPTKPEVQPSSAAAADDEESTPKPKASVVRVEHRQTTAQQQQQQLPPVAAPAQLSPEIEISNEHDVQLEEDREMERKRQEAEEARRTAQKAQEEQKRLAATADAPLEPSIERVKSTDSVPPMAAAAVVPPPSAVEKEPLTGTPNSDVTGTPVRAKSLGTGFTIPLTTTQEKPSPSRVETIARGSTSDTTDIVVEEDAPEPEAEAPSTPERPITTTTNKEVGSPDSRGSLVEPETHKGADTASPGGSPQSLGERIRSGLTKENVSNTLKNALQCAPGIATELKKQMTACTPESLSKATIEDTIPMKRTSSKFDEQFANDFLDVSMVHITSEQHNLYR